MAEERVRSTDPKRDGATETAGEAEARNHCRGRSRQRSSWRRRSRDTESEEDSAPGRPDRNRPGRARCGLYAAWLEEPEDEENGAGRCAPHGYRASNGF